MIVNIFYGNNIDSYLGTALLFFYIKNKNSDYNINLVNIDTLELKTTTLEDPIIDPIITPNSGEIYYFVGTLFDSTSMGAIITNASESYYFDNNKTRLDEFKLQAYSFTDKRVYEDSSVSHLVQHFLDISVDKCVYLIELISDYFNHDKPTEHSMDLIYGLKSYECDPLKSDIGNIGTIEKTFLVPDLHIWDYLLNSIHSTTHLQHIIYAGKHIRQYLVNNAIGNTLQDKEYIIYNFFNSQLKCQIIYGEYYLFEDYKFYITEKVHDALIVYRHNSQIKGFDIWIKFLIDIDADKLLSLYKAKKVDESRNIYHFQTSDLNFILPTDCSTDLTLKSYTKDFNFVDPYYPQNYKVLFVQCTDYIFDHAYELLFNQDVYNFFGHYWYNFSTKMWEVHIKSEYEQPELYNFELKYNAKISEDKLELILYMDETTFMADVMP